MSGRMTRAQAELVRELRAGGKLMWFGDRGPELDGRPFWPQKRTVRCLIKAGVLKWCEYLNQTHRECGFCPVVLASPVVAPALGSSLITHHSSLASPASEDAL